MEETTTQPAEQTESWQGWVGFALAISGAFLMALNVAISPWAFALYLVSSVLWIWYGIQLRARPVVAKEVIFCIINVIGVYNWLL